MENTSNYGLKRWDGEDRILHTEFNDNWDKIDTALKGSEDKAAAALAAASALEGKLGLQLIQTVQVPSGSDFAEASISVDWDQWPKFICFSSQSSPGLPLTALIFMTRSTNTLPVLRRTNPVSGALCSTPCLTRPEA